MKQIGFSRRRVGLAQPEGDLVGTPVPVPAPARDPSRWSRFLRLLGAQPPRSAGAEADFEETLPLVFGCSNFG